MEETNLKKLYRGVIIGLIVAVVPLFLLGSVQLIFGVKVSKDNATAIQKIQENYMRTDLFERWVILMEERTMRNTELANKSIDESDDICDKMTELDKKINRVYDKLKMQTFGIERCKTDTTDITFNGIF